MRNYLVLFSLIFLSQFDIYAHNIHYINLSNQLSRMRELDVISNNVANSDTIGYEEDNVLFKKFDVKQNKNRYNSFVHTDSLYPSDNVGALKNTGNKTDIAIIGHGYLKLLTPNGDRYTLNGAMIINNENILVNHMGYPYSNQDNEVITLPEEFQTIEIVESGAIYVDDEEIDVIGVFDFTNKVNNLIKEGNTMYKSLSDAFLREENYTIMSGVLKESNVNSLTAMTKLLEMQRSVTMSNSLILETTSMEKNLITKLLNK